VAKAPKCSSCGGELDIIERETGMFATCRRCGKKFRIKPRAEKPDAVSVSAKVLLDEIRESGGKVAAAPPAPSAVTPAEKRRLLPYIIVALGVIGLICILVGGLYLWRGAVAERRQQLLAAKNALEAKLPAIESDMKQGMSYFSKGRYADARDMLNLAAKNAEALMSALIDTMAKTNEDEAALFEPLKEKLINISEKISEVLATDEIRYGAKGYVKFEGKWITPEEKKRIEEERFAEEQRKKGLVFYNGRWMTPDEMNIAKGLVKFEGEWITPEERERRLKERAQKLGDRIRRFFGGRGARKPSFDPQAKEWLVDDFERGSFWNVENWGDSCELSVSEKNASKMLCISFKPSGRKKAAIGRALPLDMSSRSLLTVDVLNESGGEFQLALGVLSTRFYESKPVPIRAGLNPEVRFALKTSEYKCELDNWQTFAHTIEALERVSRIFFVIYSNQPIEAAFDNVKLLRE